MIRSTALILICLFAAEFVPDRSPRQPIPLASLVRADDPLAQQNLNFDARFSDLAMTYVETRAAWNLAALADLPAAAHLLNHARQYDYSVPKESSRALVESLMSGQDVASRAAAVGRSQAFFLGPMLDDPHWVNDVLRYLPDGFQFHGSLFLTYGYDIGVALAPHASLNAAHKHFDGHPRELLYYAIHELHHIGFNTYRPPGRIADLRTCADVLRLVEYSTELEGMAVWVARSRRETDHALTDDADYVALADASRMNELEVRYFQDYEYLKKRANEPADADALAVIDRMSGGDRLWYRVGALMASRVEQTSGRAALVRIIERGQPRLVDAYRAPERAR